MIALYRNKLKGTGLRLAAKAFLYTLLLVTAVMFVHHYAVTRRARDESAQQGVREVFSGIQQSREANLPHRVPVIPDIPGVQGGLDYAAGAAASDAAGAAASDAASDAADDTAEYQGGAGAPELWDAAPLMEPQAVELRAQVPRSAGRALRAQ